MIIYSSNKLFSSFIRGHNVNCKDVAIGTDEKNLASCCFLENSPLSDDNIRFLSFDGEEMSAGIVKNSNFFVHSYKDSHFGQFDLIYVAITNIIPIVCS